jgi:hypothetical protein
MASAALKVIEKELAAKDAEIERGRKEVAELLRVIGEKNTVIREQREQMQKGEKFYKDWVEELLPPDSAAQRAFHNSDVRGLLLGRFSLGRRGEPGAGVKRWVNGWLHCVGRVCCEWGGCDDIGDKYCVKCVKWLCKRHGLLTYGGRLCGNYEEFASACLPPIEVINLYHKLRRQFRKHEPPFFMPCDTSLGVRASAFLSLTGEQADRYGRHDEPHIVVLSADFEEGGWKAQMCAAEGDAYTLTCSAGATTCSCGDNIHRGEMLGQCKHAWHFKVCFLKIPMDSYLAYQNSYLPWEWCVERPHSTSFNPTLATYHTLPLQALHPDAAGPAPSPLGRSYNRHV